MKNSEVNEWIRQVAAALDLVRVSRNKINANFPYLSAPRCFLYAVTEAGEYIDDILELSSTGEKRNHPRQVSIMDSDKELGQVGYMICSGLLQLPGNPIEDEVAQILLHTDLTLSTSFHRVVRHLAYCCEASETLHAMSLDISVRPSVLQARVHQYALAALMNWLLYVGHYCADPFHILGNTCLSFEEKWL